MPNRVNATAGCQVVGEYVDGTENSAELTPDRCEIAPSRIVAESVDLWDRDDGMKKFTVLLKDGGTVSVRGHCLKHDPNPQQAGQQLYSVVVRNGGEETLVALFKSEDISGIFCGELNSDRKIA